MRALAPALAFLLAACSLGPGTASTPSPTVGGSPAASPAASPVASPSPSGPSVPSAATCSEAVPSGDRLVLAALAGSTQIVVRDIQDTAHARTICTLGTVGTPRFVNGHTVSYLQGTRIVRADLSTGTAVESATLAEAGFLSGLFAWSLDGSALSYLETVKTGVAWHIVTAAGNQTVATMPPVPGRGVDPRNDDAGLGFSSDGRYVALEQTFATGGTGNVAPFQIRGIDGSLAYSRDHGTMGVWAGTVYFFRDGPQFYRWGTDGVTPLTLMATDPTAAWIAPHVSPDGGSIAFYWRDGTGLSHSGVLNTGRGVVTPIGPPGRTEAAFANPNLVWYAGEKLCSLGVDANCTLYGWGRTNVFYLYDIAGHTEATSRLTALFDTWPRSA